MNTKQTTQFLKRSVLSFLIIASAVFSVFGQAFSSSADIVTVYSQNESFYIRSWPFDGEFPSLRGVSKVYRKGSDVPIYTFPRGFDSVDDESNNLILSNDGEVIFYLLSWGADEKRDGLRSISIYRHGELVQSYSAAEITGCDLNKERSEIEYSNYDEVVDTEKSNWGTPNYKKEFKTGVSDQEKFLSNFAVFCFDDIVYLTDSERNTHQFSLKEAILVSSAPFSEVFDQIKSKGRLSKVEIQSFDVPMFSDFPKLRTGAMTETALAAEFGMKPTKNYGPDADKYKNYSFKVNGFLLRNGSFEIGEIELFDALSESTIRDFFATRKFDSRSLPDSIDKWWIEDYFYFRKADTQLAIKERQEEIKQQQAALRKRLVAETINGRYIPKDLGETFVELDKELSEIDKKEMAVLKDRKDMIKYHLGLGMWIRNNWGLWGGSRLQKYFTDKGILHPDDMSGVILDYYWDWLHGDKESWKRWESDPKLAYD